MKQLRKSWKLKEWSDFSDRVKQRDGFKCLQCKRSSPEVVLQVHHEVYKEGRLPWEYVLSDCRTLCRGCHAKHHKRIEPSNGWYLLGVYDLGGLDGTCEREKCGTSIRYEHESYHPNWGYKIVGSKCIEHLTQKDKLLSSKILKLYSKISKFIIKADWEIGYTSKSTKYFQTKFDHHKIRIYGSINNYYFQIALKIPEMRRYDFKKPIFKNLKNRSFEEILELAFIALLGTISTNDEERELLRDIYRSVI